MMLPRGTSGVPCAIQHGAAATVMYFQARLSGALGWQTYANIEEF